MRVLSNMSNSFPEVARCVLARDVHVSGLCNSLSAVIAANSPSKRLPVGAISLFKQQKVPTSTRAQSKTSMGSPPNCSGPTNMDIEEPQFVRIVLLAFKESPVNGSPFGLSLFVPFLVVPPGRWDVQKNLLLVHLHVKPSPCCCPLCLSGTSMIVDLSMGQSCNFPMHISKARGGQFCLISLYRNG